MRMLRRESRSRGKAIGCCRISWGIRGFRLSLSGLRRTRLWGRWNQQVCRFHSTLGLLRMAGSSGALDGDENEQARTVKEKPEKLKGAERIGNPGWKAPRSPAWPMEVSRARESGQGSSGNHP